MLATPFVASIILARRLTWEVAAAAVAALAVFLLREPLVILGRQAQVWKERRPESSLARKWLAVEAAVLMASGVLLLFELPATPLATMGAIAVALTALSVWMAVRNRQRSMMLQIVSAAGLSMPALLGWLAARGELAPEAWWVAGLLFAHNAAAVLVVHARLELRASRAGETPSSWRYAAAVQAALVLVAVGCIAAGQRWLAAAPLLAAGVNGIALGAMRTAGGRRVPLKKVGWRAVVLSVAYCAIVIAALW